MPEEPTAPSRSPQGCHVSRGRRDPVGVFAAALSTQGHGARKTSHSVAPCLIAPIHRSNVDFAFTLFISPRKVFFMAKTGSFKVKWFGSLLAHLGAFPVHRSAQTDRESMKAAKRSCARGQALGALS